MNNSKLFELIQSLSKAEKRYFMIYAKRHKIGIENNYISLFSIIADLKEYDEAVVQQKYKRRLKKEVSNLAADKNYLYRNILKSLNEFHKGKSPNLEVKEFLHKAEILYKKELYKHSLAELRKAKKKANINELHSLSAEASVWQSKCLIKLGNFDELDKHVSDASEALALLDNYHAFAKLYYEMLRLHFKFYFDRSEKNMKLLEDFLSHPFLDSTDVPLSHKARILFHKIHSLGKNLKMNRVGEMEEYLNVIQLMHMDPAVIESNAEEYIYHSYHILEIMAEEKANNYDDFLNAFLSVNSHLPKNISVELYRVFTLLISAYKLALEIKWGSETEIKKKFIIFDSHLEKYGILLPTTVKANCYFLKILGLKIMGEIHKAQRETKIFLEANRDLLPGRILFATYILNLQMIMEIQESGETFNYKPFEEYLKKLKKSIRDTPGSPKYLRTIYLYFQEFPYARPGNRGVFKESYLRKIKEMLLSEPWLSAQLSKLDFMEWLETRKND